MNEITFDAFTRRAGSAHGRRASLKALGAAAMVAALAAPVKTEAKPSASKKARKKAKKKCQKLKEACRSATLDACNGNDECEDTLLRCCELLKTCNGAAFFDCFFDAL